MTLASSGFISLGGSTANRSVNVELGNSPTASITYPSTATRTLTGISSGALVLPNSFWGKSAVTISLSELQDRSLQEFAGGYGYITLTFNTNGTWSCVGSVSGTIASGNWASPTTSGVGSLYWIRWTRTASTLGGGSSTPSSGWLGLDAARTITVTNDGTSGGYVDSTYTLEIATDSGGSNVVASCTGTYLYAFNEF